MAINNVILMVSEEGLPKITDLKGFRGFTLAEVLITLVIIGVIAAMTIPTLINKTNNQEYVSKLKKTYSTLTQATNQIIADEGTPRVDIGGWATSPDDMLTRYKKYLSRAKECTTGQSCIGNIQYSAMPGSSVANNYAIMLNYARLVLADGTFVNFQTSNNDCSGAQIGDYNICAYIHVDINGAKGPNVWGRDAFRFYLTEHGLLPTGCNYNNTNCKDANGGQACTCVVLRENAMNY